MLPRITPELTQEPLYTDYLLALATTEFSGEIRSDYASRLTVATDNSIYQVIPQAVIFPRNTRDVAIALSLSQQEKFRTIRFSPRGGGTGTNGQSLSNGIIIDCSKYLRDILEINLEQKWVRVQPGVVLDQLNQTLRQHGVFFAPEISPSNRATIGGMVNTDACGNGSKTIGRTSDHVAELTCVLSTGQIIQTNSFTSPLTEELKQLLSQHQTQIKEKFFNAPRTLCGYNLAKAANLNYLFCGSEGTLGIITECKLKLTPLPKYKKLLVIKYTHFSDALQAKEITSDIQPLVIETIDEKLISLARQDSIYFNIKEFIDGANAVNLVEFVADDLAVMDAQIQALCKNIEKSPAAVGFYLAKNADEIKLLWELRKKSVGLISKSLDGTRRPIPFVEDTAVPPEHLANYIAEFKALLDRHQLIYGMYGHVDAGCVHVRPALDTKLANDEKLVREISDEVVTLVKKYGGVIWGEHGKGYRSEYGLTFFGDELYSVLRQIKTLFDPYNQLNPGKIAVPFNSQNSLVKLDGPLRGKLDKQISTELQADYASAMVCNGNGACFNFATNDPMCPSYKATLDRVQSPKGRATVIREWLRQLARVQFNLKPQTQFFLKKIFTGFSKKPDFSHEVFNAMSGCLSCKACANQCPLSVDVPEFKAKFLAHYYERYFRPLRDYLIANTERIAKLQHKAPRLFNWISQRAVIRMLMRKLFKVTDLPTADVVDYPIQTTSLHQLSALSEQQKAQSLIILQDAFTSFYDRKTLAACHAFFAQLGFTIYVISFFENGKPLHVKGFLHKFTRLAQRNIQYLKKIAALNIPMLGLDPSITLTYRDEYQKVHGGAELGFNILLPQEFLHANLHLLPKVTHDQYYLISHCTEKTSLVASEKQWCDIFAAMNLTLTPLTAGCCGMAGSYGHEVENQTVSQTLFSLDWQRYLCENPDAETKILTTGFSCRSQVKRFSGFRIQHPLEILSKGIS